MAEYLFYTDAIFWTIFLSLSILYCGFNFAIFLGKFKLRRDRPEWVLTWAPFVLGAFTGLLTYPGTVSGKIIGGGFIYGFLMLGIKWALIDEIAPRLIEQSKRGIPLTKLRLSEEYVDLLNSARVFTLEELVERGVVDLSEYTSLGVETLIDLRERAKKILNKK